MRRALISALEEGPLPILGWLIPDYWFMLTLAIIAGSVVAVLLWTHSGQKGQVAPDLIFYGILGLFAGSKILYYTQFGLPQSLGEIWRGSGFALYGGLLGLLVAWIVYYQIRPYPFFPFLDCVAPGLAIGLFSGAHRLFSGRLQWGPRLWSTLGCRLSSRYLRISVSEGDRTDRRLGSQLSTGASDPALRVSLWPGSLLPAVPAFPPEKVGGTGLLDWYPVVRRLSIRHGVYPCGYGRAASIRHSHIFPVCFSGGHLNGRWLHLASFQELNPQTGLSFA